MWIFTPNGFTSAVQHFDKPDTVVLRFRTREDAEWMVATLRTRAGAKRKVHATPKADYPFRVFVTKKRFAKWLSWYVLDRVTYANFKSAVATEQGHERAHVYHDVWAVLREQLDTRSFRHSLQSGGF